LPDVKGQKTGEANLNFVISEPKRQKKPSLSGAIDKRPAGQFPKHEGFRATFQTQLSLSDRRITLLLAILAQTGAGNVECLDFILSGSGIATTADVAFTGFDRGLARRTAHGGVEIALALSLGSITANGPPDAKAPTNCGGNLATAPPADYGATNPVANFACDLFRSSSGDNLATSDREVTGTQGIAGSVIDPSAFNVPPGSLIDGYSLFSTDVTSVWSVANRAHGSITISRPTLNRLGCRVDRSNQRSFEKQPPEKRNLRPELRRTDDQLGRLPASSRPARTQNMTETCAPPATSRAV
jgi:hypothetical protein